MLNRVKWAALPALLLCNTLLASNACITEVITTSADVAVSDGSAYSVETYYRSADEAAVSFLGEGASDIVSEGPFAWYRQGKKTGLASDKEKRFALGHQYHAMVLHFDEIMANVADDPAIEFLGETRTGRTGEYPTGGTVSLVEGDNPAQPAGFLMLLPEETPITVTLDDWRESEAGAALPYTLQIHHGDRVFTYTYTSVAFSQGDAVDFHERYATPGVTEIDEFRQQQALLAEQCRTDRE